MSTIKQLIELFRTFLIKNRYKEKWIINYITLHKSSSHLELLRPPFDFLSMESPNDFIDFAFQWSSSPEGDLYWRSLNFSWLRYLQEKKSLLARWFLKPSIIKNP